MFESTVVSADVKPILLDLPGVSVRVLHRGNAESGQVVITRMAPGAVIPEHFHSEADEMVFILDGDFCEAGVRYGPGTLFIGKAGLPHGPHTTSTGCTVLTHFSHAALDFNV